MNSQFEYEKLFKESIRNQKESLYDFILKKSKENLFIIHYHLLKIQFQSFSMELFAVIIQTFQLLAFFFNSAFNLLWKPVNMFNLLSAFFSYFQIGSFTELNSTIYFICFFLCIIAIFLTYVLSIMIIIPSSHKSNQFIIIRNLLQKIMYILSTVLYIPILKLLISIFKCAAKNLNEKVPINSNTFYLFNDNSIQCWTGLHIFYVVLGGLFLMLFLFQILMFNSTCFETHHSNHNLNGQSSGQHEVLSKIIAFIYTIFFELLSTNLSFCLVTMVMIILMFIFSWYSLYQYYYLNPHYNRKLFCLNYTMKAIILWANFCLLLARFLRTVIPFDCSTGLFLFGIPIIFLIVFSKEEDDLYVLISLSMKQTHGKDYERITSILLRQLDDIDNRSSQVALRGYAFYIEKTCTLIECPIKKYMDSMNNKNEAQIFLLNHIETIYQNGIKKYPNCISLRISYCRFLIERMNKKQLAFNNLSEIEYFPQSFEEQFIVFRYKKQYEETGAFNFDTSYTDDQSFKSFYYLNKKFRSHILKVSALYIEFWGLLSQNQIEEQQDLSLLNEIGTQIRLEIQEIDDLFNYIQQIVHDRKEILTLYADYLTEVLHNSSKKLQLKEKLDELHKLILEDQTDYNLEYLDMHLLNKTDRYLYMIINGQYDYLGQIVNISLGLCSLFGYTKEEVSGKNMTVLIPSIVQQGHTSLLKKKLDTFIKKGFETKNSKPEFNETTGFVLSKSKYIISLSFKHCLFQTENKEYYWLIKVSHEHKALALNCNKVSYILTDNNLLIQYFTGNSVRLLGLSSCVIGSNIDITKYIKELHEDCFQKMIEMEDKTIEMKRNLKRSLVKTKYKTPMMITWKRQEQTDDINRNDSLKTETVPYEPTIKQKSLLLSSTATILLNQRDLCYLTVTPLIFLDDEVGFIFKLEQVADCIDTIPINPRKSIVNNSEIQSKKGNETTHIQSIQNNELFHTIDKCFVPNSLTGMNFDPQTMGYKLNETNKEQQKEIITYLKNQALNKLNEKANQEQGKNKELSSSSESSNSYDEGSLNYQNHLSSSYDSEEQCPVIVKNLVNTNDDDNYYKVNFSKIKFSIINYTQQRYIEENYPFTSKVVEAIENLSSNNSQVKTKNKEKNILATSITTDILSTNITDKHLNNYYKYSSLIKQIERALHNKDSQTSIVKLTWVSIILFFIIIANNLIFLFTGLMSFSAIGKDISLLKASYSLINYSTSSLLHVRELLLLRFDKYDIKYQSKDEYRKNITEEMAGMFIKMSDIINKLSQSANELSSSDYDLIYNTFFRVDLIENDYTVITYNLSLLSSISKLSSALYRITQLDQNDLTALQTEVFFFTRNIINYPFLSLINQSEVYARLLENLISISKRNSILIFCVCNTFTLLCYIFITKFYSEVIKRKESYLEVFYEIRSNVIQASLNQCITFVQRIQNPDDSRYDTTMDLESINLNEDDTLLNQQQNQNNEEKGNQIIKKENQHHKNHQKIKRVVTEEALRKIHFLIIIIVVIILASISLIFLIQSVNSLKTCMNIYVIQSQLQNNMLIGFNIIREYLYDNKSPVLGLELEKIALTLYNEYMATMQKLEKEMNVHFDELSKDYLQLYQTIQYKSLCNYTLPFYTEFYPNDSLQNCSGILSNSAAYGLPVLLSAFANQMNDIKNIYLLFEKLFEGTSNGNLTLYGTNQFIGNPNTNSHLAILSHIKTQELVITVKFILYPIFYDIIQSISDEIDSMLSYSQTLGITILTTFSILEFLWFILRWRGFLSSLNQIIYKAKNMLNIIPVEILVSLTSIHKLLKIKVIPGSIIAR